MAATESSVQDHLSKLDVARKLVLDDSALYPQIVERILPHIGVHARLELRRWGMDFLAEMFASPQLAAMHKQSLSLMVLETLQAVVEMEEQDTTVLKSAVQASASIYPLVFRHM